MVPPSNHKERQVGQRACWRRASQLLCFRMLGHGLVIAGVSNCVSVSLQRRRLNWPRATALLDMPTGYCCELLYSLHFTVPCSSLSNNNNNSHDNVYGAVIMTKVIARVHPVHLMNADWAPGGRQHSDQASRFGLWVHRKLAAVIHIHHHHCYYYSDSFYHPMKGGRLAWDNIYVVKGAINQAFTALIVIEGITFDPMPLTMVQTAPKDHTLAR